MNVFKNYDTQYNKIPLTYYNKNYDKTMNLKIRDFYWASSYKSYLPCGQSYDVYSYDMINNILNTGARVINLDIYESSSLDPVVRSEYSMPYFGKPLELNKCLEIINENAWKNNDNPLILYLTINTDSTVTMNKIAEYLFKNLGNKFIGKKYSFNGRNLSYPIADIDIIDVMGKLIIITDKYPLSNKLNEFINSTTSETQQQILKMNYANDNEKYGGLEATMSNLNKIIYNNKLSLSIVTPQINKSFVNLYNPKYDIYNIKAEDCWKYGCQIVLMNYQLYDKNMINYISKFKNSGLVLKPDNLRYIPSPPEKILTQNKNLSYSPMTVKPNGWKMADFNI